MATSESPCLVNAYQHGSPSGRWLELNTHMVKHAIKGIIRLGATIDHKSLALAARESPELILFMEEAYEEYQQSQQEPNTQERDDTTNETPTQKIYWWQLLSVILIIVILVSGVTYYWLKKVKKRTSPKKIRLSRKLFTQLESIAGKRS